MSSVFTSLLNSADSKTGDWNGEWKVSSPAQHEQILGQCAFRYADIDRAVTLAQNSFQQLKTSTLAERKAVLLKAIRCVQSARESLLQISALELGRGPRDLEQEWSQLDRFFKGLMSDQALDTLVGQARGVSAVIGSYVWPLFYSVQFSFLNFLAGNSVVLKPSEKSTLTVIRIFELLRKEIPELEAVQVLVGDREIGRRLVCHEGVSTVLFQGSFEVGMRVRQDTLSQPGKEVLLYLGAKNPAIVFADAPDSLYQTLLQDAFQGTGQDCQSLSVVFVEASFLPKFSARFHVLSKEFKIGAPETGAFMGPLIDGPMLDRYLKFIGISEREGGEVLMRGKPLSGVGKGHYVTPTLAQFETLSPEQMRKSVSLQTEILSPHLSFVSFENEESLLGLLQQMNHGRLASVWSADLGRAQRLAQSIDCGRVAINRSLLALDPWTSFQSRKRSGNHASLGRGLLSQLSTPKQIEMA